MDRYELFALLKEIADPDNPEPIPHKSWSPICKCLTLNFEPSIKLKDQRAFEAMNKIVQTRKYHSIPLQDLYEKYVMLAAEYGSLNFYSAVNSSAKNQGIDLHKDYNIMIKRLGVLIRNNHIEILKYIVENHINVFYLKHLYAYAYRNLLYYLIHENRIDRIQDKENKETVEYLFSVFPNYRILYDCNKYRISGVYYTVELLNERNAWKLKYQYNLLQQGYVKWHLRQEVYRLIDLVDLPAPLLIAIIDEIQPIWNTYYCVPYYIKWNMVVAMKLRANRRYDLANVFSEAEAVRFSPYETK